MIENRIAEALRTLKQNEYFVADSTTGREYTYAQCFGLAKYVSIQLL